MAPITFAVFPMVHASHNGAAQGRPCCGSRADLLAVLDDPTQSVDRDSGTLLIVADVDDFRAYNARHGYEAGDGVLELLERRLTEVGTAFHLGADTFAVLLAGTPLDIADRLALVLARLTVEDPEPVHCSLGAALVPLEASGSGALALAEERLEDQKRRGLFLADRITEILLVLMGAHDDGLRQHASEVARLAESVAGRLGLGVAERTLVRRTAELHDVGKLGVDRRVLDKRKPLDESEWEQIRRHTVIGDELLQRYPSLATLASIVRATHERPDGAGYPDGAGAEEIPLAARIVAACDAYHAMVSNRPYAAARSADAARAELETYAGSQFDRSVVSALVAELSDRDPVAEELAAAPSGDGSLRRLTRLHALLESASMVEDPDHLPEALDAVAQVVGESLGYGAVVINLYRHDLDDFVVSTTYGDDPTIRQLLGATYGWEIWDRLLDPRFRRAGAYTIYAGEYDWTEQTGHRVVPQLGNDDHPDAWQGEDEIFVPFHHSDGHILGIFNVSSPSTGRRPSDEELQLLTLVVRHAARAVQRAQEMAAAAAHRRALEQLLRVSSTLTRTASGTSVLQAISAGISEALGFERVVVFLREPATDVLAPAAASGIEVDDPRLRLPFGYLELERLFVERFENEGCYLIPREAAEAQVPNTSGIYRSTRNGRGTWAWQHHWLAVPLRGRDGSCLGVVFADDPVDRLLPTRERLQALRLFADQATVALESVAQYETQRYLAEHDALTSLRNRHAFMAELAAALRNVPLGRPVALVYCDLDRFKELNDEQGHAAGDEALAHFARILTDSLRSEDSAFRIGGDEFALLLPGCEEVEAERVVERTLASWAATWSADDAQRHLGASFGIAVCHRNSEANVEELLRRADEAMYEAKRTQSRLRIAA